MTETIITVKGRFSSAYPPERARVELSVSFEGSDRDSVFEGTTVAADLVRDEITDLHDHTHGPVTAWTSDSVHVWSHRPWSEEGRRLNPVFHAAMAFSATFNDFEALARFIERVAVIDGVTVGAIDWTLTDARRTAVTAEVRSRAVKDAVAKASVYAQSIGLASVRAIAIADPGMLGDQTLATTARFEADMLRMTGAGGELQFRPEDIEVIAEVDARFVAS
ncbi:MULTISPECIES: SIMPL domain-containing protein [unclassified Diaminobutyricimonas]|uniref:SIMPL domain-containing protein n=1 Tax=unclassified Diaminobutyricimonas TaxID=2643261 RepID=UPI0012F4AAD5|nr:MULTISPECIES: SIMPL domain-containing protein [unclassified Diaminobutyricimonas]